MGEPKKKDPGSFEPVAYTGHCYFETLPVEVFEQIIKVTVYKKKHKLIKIKNNSVSTIFLLYQIVVLCTKWINDTYM